MLSWEETPDSGATGRGPGEERTWPRTRLVWTSVGAPAQLPKSGSHIPGSGRQERGAAMGSKARRSNTQEPRGGGPGTAGPQAGSGSRHPPAPRQARAKGSSRASRFQPHSLRFGDGLPARRETEELESTTSKVLSLKQAEGLAVCGDLVP